MNTETTDTGYQEILRRIREEEDTRVGTYSYRDETGKEQLVVYKYLKDRGWVFLVREPAAEVFRAVTSVRIIVGVLCALVAAAILSVTLLILRREGQELMTVERAISRLGDLNLSADKDLEGFYSREDEIGRTPRAAPRSYQEITHTAEGGWQARAGICPAFCEQPQWSCRRDCSFRLGFYS